MDFVDKIKDAAKGHESEISGAIEQVGNFVDDKTGGQFAGQVDQAQDFLKDQLSGDAATGAGQ